MWNGEALTRPAASQTKRRTRVLPERLTFVTGGVTGRFGLNSLGYSQSMLWWIILAIVIGLLLIGTAAVLGRRRRADARRSRASAIRAEAGEQSIAVERREASAREAEARARAARAESDVKAAESSRLTAQAQQEQLTAAEHRDKVQADLAQADQIDPDIDGDGNRKVRAEGDG